MYCLSLSSTISLLWLSLIWGPVVNYTWHPNIFLFFHTGTFKNWGHFLFGWAECDHYLSASGTQEEPARVTLHCSSTLILGTKEALGEFNPLPMAHSSDSTLLRMSSYPRSPPLSLHYHCYSALNTLTSNKSQSSLLSIPLIFIPNWRFLWRYSTKYFLVNVRPNLNNKNNSHGK